MSEKTTENTPLKRSIDDLDLFDLPMVGIFKDKRYTAYTLSTLAGIEVENLDEMDVAVEDFLANTEEGKRDMRMDARINITYRRQSCIHQELMTQMKVWMENPGWNTMESSSKEKWR